MAITREKAQLMSASEIDRTLVRLAHEILEKTKDLDQLAFIGIRRRGVPLAQRLSTKIESLESRKVPVGILDINLYRDDLSTVDVKPVVSATEIPFSVAGKDIILILGGLFLLGKSTHEIHEKLEGEDGEVSSRVAPKFTAVVIQILLLDIVFSLDSVITAVGMARKIEVMIAAVIIALVFMLFFAGRISDFIHKHPSLKMLALSFLLLIGCALVAEGFHKEIPKGYIYFAMAFSVGVESLNIKMRARKRKPVELHQPYR